MDELAPPPMPVRRFRPGGQSDLAPSGDVARVRANLAALTALRGLQAGQRAATPDEQAVLARWSGWGAVPAVFDPNAAAYARYDGARADLRALLTVEEYAAAERSTLNAHYTDVAYVQAVWDAVARLGFRDGAVLEPGCGAGNFLAFAPEGARLVGVELEPVTAAIAGAVHPHAQIHAESFADSRMPEGTFDVVVGNVPFGDVTLHDRRHNAGAHRIHNHFLIKGLHLTRPGGLVAVLTSRYTMDAANPAARREMAALGDLVGAVRLPTGAHRRAAGTDVVTDVLILRRREEGREPAGAAFEQSRTLSLEGADEPFRINEYFLAHPQHVLGELCAETGALGRAELGVAGERSAGPALTQALADIAARAHDAGLVMSQGAPHAPARAGALVGASSRRPDGYLTACGDGTFTRVEQGQEVPYRPPASQAGDLRALLRLRNNVVALLEAEAASIDGTADMVALRADLNARYEGYVAAYGPINRFTWRSTGRIDPVSGDEKLARISPPQGGFRSDPFANVVYALEHFDPSTQTATKATIFRERVVARRAARLGADTPADALAICLDTVGEVSLDRIARLLGVAPDEARERLGPLVFDEPGSRRLVPAAEYLSGNVRAKLTLAVEASADDATFAPNVTALTAVIPRDLAPDEIHARLGAAWISADYVRQFLREILEDETVIVEHPGGALWVVKSSYSGSVLATSRWGTDRYSAGDIAQALLEQRPIRIYDEVDGARVFNPTATIAAAEKASEMGERFSEWVWEDPERSAVLARTFNDRFNAIVPRSYDGVTLSLPGLAVTFQPRPHQVAAVARIINEPAVGLFHEVGAGKTAEMVMGAMELRRLGLVNKPVVVVPNHMLEQFSREWLQLYPQAKLLAAAREDLDRGRRRLFVAKVATGDWDAIIMTRSAFERIAMSPEAQRAYLEREVSAIVSMIERAKAEDSRFSLKRLQRMKLQAEERLKSKLDGAKDPGITFEQLGVDYIFADEAHAYKNLRTTSNIPGMAVDGSQRASDLHMKIEYLRERHGRVATLATATPIANSMGEAYTMQRYLRPDLLEDAGVADFDVWAATFGETTTVIEVAPDGSGMRMNTRFAKFRNVPELLLLWRVSADIKTGEDLNLPVPALATRASDGARAAETAVVAPSDELKAYVAELARRAEKVRGRGVDPSVDNMLNISSDGRAAALDVRLVHQATSEPQKVHVAAERIASIYDQCRDDTFPGPDGQPHPVRGALQLVFGDLGTPKPGAWSVYEQLRTQLVAKGLPREAIRFVHEARNDREKGELFAACRDGRIAVLIGSTERMGVGTNVQLRAVALHHLDCPWRPADLAQRDGRILRPGNANAEVRIVRYVTEGSFDAYLWQTVTRKAQFIAQVMRGRLDVREIEDIGDAALSYNEVKALATGNPLLLEQARAQAEVNRLDRLQRSHARSQDTLRWTARETEMRIARATQRVEAAEGAIARRIPMPAEAFTMTVGERAYDKRADANKALREALERHLVRRGPRDTAVPVGTLRGFAVTSTLAYDARGITLAVDGVPGSDIPLVPEDLAKVALVTRVENRVTNLETMRDNAVLERTRLCAELERARGEIGRAFRNASQLAVERERLRELDEQLLASAAPPVVPPVPPGVEAAGVDATAPVVDARPYAGAVSTAAPAVRPYEPTVSAPGPAVPDARLVEGERLEALWTAAVAHEFAAVRVRATALGGRLAALAVEHRLRLIAHRDNDEPKRPSAVALVVGARARYEAAVDEWSTAQDALARRVRQLEARRDRVREYATAQTAGCPSKGTELARRRLETHNPALARDVAAFRTWRQEQETERVARERAARRERERAGRGGVEL